MEWESLESVKYMAAGFGLAAFMGLIPMAVFVYWFAKTYATERWVAELIMPLTQDNRDTKTRLYSMEMREVKQDAILERLTEVLDDLKETLKTQHIHGPQCCVASDTENSKRTK